MNWKLGRAFDRWQAPPPDLEASRVGSNNTYK